MMEAKCLFVGQERTSNQLFLLMDHAWLSRRFLIWLKALDDYNSRAGRGDGPDCIAGNDVLELVSSALATGGGSAIQREALTGSRRSGAEAERRRGGVGGWQGAKMPEQSWWGQLRAG